MNSDSRIGERVSAARAGAVPNIVGVMAKANSAAILISVSSLLPIDGERPIGGNAAKRNEGLRWVFPSPYVHPAPFSLSEVEGHACAFAARAIWQSVSLGLRLRSS
ncbi:hypothetical protein SPKIRA_31000 [Sphingomonas paucimobilis]|nr:hypothetical protein SPKIRA_31000 [Sphingomonas paucimobilis]